MKYRRLDPNGDYVLGAPGQFLANTPETVAQAILTRLRLPTGEWFLDTEEGIAYDPLILGHSTQGSRDAEVQSRILETRGVLDIESYSSSVEGRSFRVSARVNTIYGPTQVTGIL